MVAYSDVRTVDLFAGPGGWEMGAHILGGRELVERLSIAGVEISPDACTTARRAGHRRLTTRQARGVGVADVRDLHPSMFPEADGLIVSAPCPPFSTAGRRTGLAGDVYQAILDAIEHMFSEGCECAIADLAALTSDPRVVLMLEIARWTCLMPALQWVAVEQVPAIELAWEDFIGELRAADWMWDALGTFDAAQLGTSVHRERTFAVGLRDYGSSQALPLAGVQYAPAPTWAHALGWPAGERVRTRGNLRSGGGNLFSTDGVGWCLTGSSRSWVRESDGLRITPAEAGFLNGFPRDHYWHGSNTSAHLQTGNVVCPPAAAAVLGTVLNIPWHQPVFDWATARYDALGAAPVAA